VTAGSARNRAIEKPTAFSTSGHKSEARERTTTTTIETICRQHLHQLAPSEVRRLQSMTTYEHFFTREEMIEM